MSIKTCSLQKSSCMTGNNESVKFNVTKSDTIISEQSQELQKRIGNLETLTTVRNSLKIKQDGFRFLQLCIPISRLFQQNITI